MLVGEVEADTAPEPVAAGAGAASAANGAAGVGTATAVGVATVGVFVYWYLWYNTSLDGHSLVTWDQLRLWKQCDASAIANPASVFYNFAVSNSGGIDIGADACNYFHDGKVKAVSMSLSVLVIIEMFNALNALSEDSSLIQMPPWANPWLLVAITLSTAVHMMIMYVPWMATLFQITALDTQDWLVIVLFSFPVIVLDEILKCVGRIKQAAELKARLGDKKKAE